MDLIRYLWRAAQRGASVGNGIGTVATLVIFLIGAGFGVTVPTVFHRPLWIDLLILAMVILWVLVVGGYVMWRETEAARAALAERLGEGVEPLATKAEVGATSADMKAKAKAEISKELPEAMKRKEQIQARRNRRRR